MKIGHIEFFVRDPIRSLEFYKDILGFEVTCIQGDGACVWLKLADTELLLRRGSPPKGSNRYRDASSGIVIYCDNLDLKSADLISKGLRFSGDDGSNREPTFSDPDGHWFQLVDPKDFA